ncbi:MAG: redoxin domain-containing protein [Gammaproteobacteria bacterium]
MTLLRIVKAVITISVFGFLYSGISNAQARVLPEFTQQDSSQWINSDAISVADLQGYVVLIDVWTFECWNCYRSFPWLNDLEKRYSDKGLKIIGIHTPEFSREKVLATIKQKVTEFKLHHPVMVDNDMAYWRALNNRYWPAFYIVDKKGNIRTVAVGETHSGDRNAVKIESTIKTLLAE